MFPLLEAAAVTVKRIRRSSTAAWSGGVTVIERHW